MEPYEFYVDHFTGCARKAGRSNSDRFSKRRGFSVCRLLALPCQAPSNGAVLS